MVGLEHGGPVMVSMVNGEIRIQAPRQVLADLHAEAQDVLAGIVPARTNEIAQS
jgi:hypothetical protein